MFRLFVLSLRLFVIHAKPVPHWPDGAFQVAESSTEFWWDFFELAFVASHPLRPLHIVYFNPLHAPFCLVTMSRGWFACVILARIHISKARIECITRGMCRELKTKRALNVADVVLSMAVCAFKRECVHVCAREMWKRATLMWSLSRYV